MPTKRVMLIAFILLMSIATATATTFHAHAQEELPGDIDGDANVDPFDFSTFRLNYGKSRQGTGILYAYTDENESEEVTKNAAGNYQIYPGVIYHFKIENITEYENKRITVWACYKVDNTPYNVEIKKFHVENKPWTIHFNWTIPDLPITTSIKFKYGTDHKGPRGTWYYAAKGVYPSPPRLLLVIPEVFLGPISAIAALFLGFRARTFIRKRTKSH